MHIQLYFILLPVTHASMKNLDCKAHIQFGISSQSFWTFVVILLIIWCSLSWGGKISVNSFCFFLLKSPTSDYWRRKLLQSWQYDQVFSLVCVCQCLGIVRRMTLIRAVKRQSVCCAYSPSCVSNWNQPYTVLSLWLCSFGCSASRLVQVFIPPRLHWRFVDVIVWYWFLYWDPVHVSSLH